MKLPHLLLAAATGAIVAASLLYLMGIQQQHRPSSTGLTDTTYERVIAKNELTCGTYVLNNLFQYNPKTNAPSGLVHDLMQEVAARMRIKIKWIELSSFATMYEDLKLGRFDMICFPLLVFGYQYKTALFSDILFYDNVYLYGDAARNFTAIKSYEDVNTPSSRIAVMEGELGGYLAPLHFPKARLAEIPQTAPAGTLFLDILSNKADLIIMTRLGAESYLQTNPGKIKPIMERPLTSIGFRFAYKPQSLNLQRSIDSVIADLKIDGTFDKLFQKYGFGYLTTAKAAP